MTLNNNFVELYRLALTAARGKKTLMGLFTGRVGRTMRGLVVQKGDFRGS
jgi:hypothetical protein